MLCGTIDPAMRPHPQNNIFSLQVEALWFWEGKGSHNC